MERTFKTGLGEWTASAKSRFQFYRFGIFAETYSLQAEVPHHANHPIRNLEARFQF